MNIRGSRALEQGQRPDGGGEPPVERGQGPGDPGGASLERGQRPDRGGEPPVERGQRPDGEGNHLSSEVNDPATEVNEPDAGGPSPLEQGEQPDTRAEGARARSKTGHPTPTTSTPQPATPAPEEHPHLTDAGSKATGPRTHMRAEERPEPHTYPRAPSERRSGSCPPSEGSPVSPPAG